MTNQPLLEVRDLQTVFELDEGTVKAVDGVSFDVYPGRVLGIVGESGCGKSVTIKSVLRLIEEPGRIANGTIRFRSKILGNSSAEMVDLVQLPAKSAQLRALRGNEIALIPQEPMAAFSPVHTIGNQLMEVIQLHQPVSDEEAKKIAVNRLKEVGVPNPEGAMDRYSWELSGGLRQRAMIGMALTCDPLLLIADEPTTAIDVTTQAQVLSLLRKLQQEHQTSIIFITHDLGVIAQLADDVVVMYLGKVMESGPVDQIFHHPQHPSTRALLRSIPTVHTKNRSRLPTISGSIPHPFQKRTGCPFVARCQEALPEQRCANQAPVLKAINEHQSVSCFLHQGGGNAS
jgi:oligopeptide/dipeptide ABC transporter ATP-binding protein